MDWKSNVLHPTDSYLFYFHKGVDKPNTFYQIRVTYLSNYHFWSSLHIKFWRKHCWGPKLPQMSRFKWLVQEWKLNFYNIWLCNFLKTHSVKMLLPVWREQHIWNFLISQALDLETKKQDVKNSIWIPIWRFWLQSQAWHEPGPRVMLNQIWYDKNWYG